VAEEDAEPKDARPEDTEPEDTEPEDTKPEDTEPEDTEPEDTKPEDTEPEDTEPENTEPEDDKTIEAVKELIGASYLSGNASTWAWLHHLPVSESRGRLVELHNHERHLQLQTATENISSSATSSDMKSGTRKRPAAASDEPIMKTS
jgi:hypothetical protein